MSASPTIEAWAREPFAIGELGDTPREAAKRMRWIPVRFGLGSVIARTADGREMVVTEGDVGCIAREASRGE